MPNQRGECPRLKWRRRHRESVIGSINFEKSSWQKDWQLAWPSATPRSNCSIITVSAKAAGEEASAWAAKCAEQKQQYPSRTLCYSISVALQAPPVIKIQQQENCAISNRDVEQLCALITEDRAEELARACMSSNAARQRRAVAVLKR